MASDVEGFRDWLDVKILDTVDAIRAIIVASHPGMTERIKWNAPSYAINGDDRITLDLERKGGVRLVLHSGAKPKTLGGFSFDDRDGLARWPAPDRGIVVFRDEAEVEQRGSVAGPTLPLACGDQLTSGFHPSRTRPRRLKPSGA